MSCTFPLPAWRNKDIHSKQKIVFDPNKGLPSTKMFIPCGQCIACRLARARDWAHRCVHEASLHSHNCFLTLTYNDDNLVWTDKGPTLYHRHFQLFMKRLRKRHPDLNIRYFMCGEYGEEFHRPHYHVCLFGYDFPDRKPFQKSGSFIIYSSDELSSLWEHGYHSIGELNFDTACYCARYIMKKVTGEKADDHYGNDASLSGSRIRSRAVEYCAMSRRPGIGRNYFDRYKADLYNADICVTKPDFISKPPKYYDRLLACDSPDWHDAIKATRRSNLQEPDYKECARQAEFNVVKQGKLMRKYEKNLLT